MSTQTTEKTVGGGSVSDDDDESLITPQEGITGTPRDATTASIESPVSFGTADYRWRAPTRADERRAISNQLHFYDTALEHRYRDALARSRPVDSLACAVAVTSVFFLAYATHFRELMQRGHVDSVQTTTLLEQVAWACACILIVVAGFATRVPPTPLSQRLFAFFMGALALALALLHDTLVASSGPEATLVALVVVYGFSDAVDFVDSLLLGVFTCAAQYATTFFDVDEKDENLQENNIDGARFVVWWTSRRVQKGASVVFLVICGVVWSYYGHLTRRRVFWRETHERELAVQTKKTGAAYVDLACRLLPPTIARRVLTTPPTPNCDVGDKTLFNEPFDSELHDQVVLVARFAPGAFFQKTFSNNTISSSASENRDACIELDRAWQAIDSLLDAHWLEKLSGTHDHLVAVSFAENCFGNGEDEEERMSFLCNRACKAAAELSRVLGGDAVLGVAVHVGSLRLHLDLDRNAYARRVQAWGPAIDAPMEHLSGFCGDHRGCYASSDVCRWLDERFFDVLSSQLIGGESREKHIEWNRVTMCASSSVVGLQNRYDSLPWKSDESSDEDEYEPLIEAYRRRLRGRTQPIDGTPEKLYSDDGVTEKIAHELMQESPSMVKKDDGAEENKDEESDDDEATTLYWADGFKLHSLVLRDEEASEHQADVAPGTFVSLLVRAVLYVFVGLAVVGEEVMVEEKHKTTTGVDTMLTALLSWSMRFGVPIVTLVGAAVFAARFRRVGGEQWRCVVAAASACSIGCALIPLVDFFASHRSSRTVTNMLAVSSTTTYFFVGVDLRAALLADLCAYASLAVFLFYQPTQSLLSSQYEYCVSWSDVFTFVVLTLISVTARVRHATTQALSIVAMRAARTRARAMDLVSRRMRAIVAAAFPRAWVVGVDEDLASVQHQNNRFRSRVLVVRLSLDTHYNNMENNGGGGGDEDSTHQSVSFWKPPPTPPQKTFLEMPAYVDVETSISCEMRKALAALHKIYCFRDQWMFVALLGTTTDNKGDDVDAVRSNCITVQTLEFLAGNLSPRLSTTFPRHRWVVHEGTAVLTTPGARKMFYGAWGSAVDECEAVLQSCSNNTDNNNVSAVVCSSIVAHRALEHYGGDAFDESRPSLLGFEPRDRVRLAGVSRASVLDTYVVSASQYSFGGDKRLRADEEKQDKKNSGNGVLRDEPATTRKYDNEEHRRAADLMMEHLMAKQ
jgi:hypothetical protein